MPEFVASLPLVAVDGTMRKRLARCSKWPARAHMFLVGLVVNRK